MRTRKPVSKGVLVELKRFEARFLSVIEASARDISEPCVKVVEAGGKRLRPALVIICASLGNKTNSEELFLSAMGVELIHLASLVHDDILDAAKTRRGVPTINESYGEKQAILIGDYLFGLSFQLLSDCGNNSLITPLASASLFLSEGELRQRRDLRRLDQSVHDYLDRIYAKTAALFEASCSMGAIIGGLSSVDQERLREYARGLGIAFQIYDDILDFTGDEKVLGKPTGNDIREGTVTLPMIFALEKNCLELAEAIDDPAQEKVEEAVVAVKRCGAIEQARSLAKEYVEKAEAAAGNLRESQGKKDLISLGKFVIDRYH